MMPFISIIMPAYNAEATIEDTIRSVLQQDYTDWELIIVDDASKDTTSGIIHRFIENGEQRIRYFYNDGDQHGPSIGRNMGITAARGEWIMFLDADDLYLPGRLTAYVQLIQRIGGPAAIHSNYLYYINGQHKKRWVSLLGEPAKYKRGNLFENKKILEKCTIGILTVAIHRTILDKTGLFDTSLKGTEDYDLWIRIAMAGYKWYYIPASWSLYTIIPNSLSRNIHSYSKALLDIYHKYKAHYSNDKRLDQMFTAMYSRWKANMFYDSRDYVRARRYFEISIRHDQFSYRKLTAWAYLAIMKLKGK